MTSRRRSKEDFNLEFKKLAKDNDVRRLDDEFLSRFLTGHNYDVFKALRAVQNYESFISRRKETWLNLKNSTLQKIFEAQVIDILHGTGIQDQTVVLINVGKWDYKEFSADEILEVSGLLCELAYLELKTIKHIDIIIDMKGLSLGHLQGLSTKFAKRLNFFLSECLPMTLLKIYVIREPKIFQIAYAIFKPLIPEKGKDMICICGNNLNYLLANIGSDVLPFDLGGNLSETKPQRWLNVLHSNKYQKELHAAGYNFY